MAKSVVSAKTLLMVALCILHDNTVLGNNACEKIQGTDATSSTDRKCVAGGCAHGGCYAFHVNTELDLHCMDSYSSEKAPQFYECCEYQATSCVFVNGVATTRDSIESPIKRLLDRASKRQQQRQPYN